MLHKAKETRKVPKLKDILKAAIEQRNRVQAQKRKLREMFDNPRNLLFSSIKPSLNSNQFEMVHDQTAKIVRAIEIKHNMIDQLRTKIETMLAPVEKASSRHKKLSRAQTFTSQLTEE